MYLEYSNDNQFNHVEKFIYFEFETLPVNIHQEM